ncbi:hypothetical protein EMMF5_003163 [Cystobasidiomycetes sp. EMM_F5]
MATTSEMRALVELGRNFILEYYQQSVDNAEIMNTMKEGDYAGAVAWVYHNIRDDSGAVANCEAYILAAFCWLNLDAPSSASADLKLALELFEELPEFHENQPFPYAVDLIQKLYSTLCAQDMDPSERIARAKALVPFGSLNAPVAKTTPEAVQASAEGLRTVRVKGKGKEREGSADYVKNRTIKREGSPHEIRLVRRKVSRARIPNIKSTRSHRSKSL